MAKAQGTQPGGRRWAPPRISSIIYAKLARDGAGKGASVPVRRLLLVCQNPGLPPWGPASDRNPGFQPPKYRSFPGHFALSGTAKCGVRRFSGIWYGR
jgi:hypothetical protein